MLNPEMIIQSKNILPIKFKLVFKDTQIWRPRTSYIGYGTFKYLLIIYYPKNKKSRDKLKPK